MRLGTQSRLTLISAPAGFAKTTLLAAWLAERCRGLAWLSFDQTDNDLTAFWSHLVAALRKAADAIGADFPDLLAAEQPPETLLARLRNALSAMPAYIDLVLDDYHVIGQPEIEAGLSSMPQHAVTPIRTYELRLVQKLVDR